LPFAALEYLQTGLFRSTLITSYELQQKKVFSRFFVKEPPHRYSCCKSICDEVVTVS